MVTVPNFIRGGSALASGAKTAASPSSFSGGLSTANQSLYDQDINTVQSDLNSNNFTGAWNTALQSSGLFDQVPVPASSETLSAAAAGAGIAAAL
jgi:hypothetical protein